ncbi:MAG TPA: hypothetical protein VF039_14360 [Longimicrobiales bacterium]
MTASLRTPARALWRALALGALLALPFGCDDDGTGPRDPDVRELPDTVPGGELEVESLLVPAGERIVVEGDLVVRATHDIRILGDVLVDDDVMLVLLAEDSLVVAGAIGSIVDSATAAAGASRSLTRGRAGSGGVIALGGNVVTIERSDFTGLTGREIHVTTLGADGTINIRARLETADGPASLTRDVPGANGGDLDIGTASSEFWQEIGVPAEPTGFINFDGAYIWMGAGGPGYHDQNGILEGQTLVARGSAGGRGGRAWFRASTITGEVSFHPGRGGAGGWCGWPKVSYGYADWYVYPSPDSAIGPLISPSGHEPLESGVDIDCTTGTGGDGGAVIVEATPIGLAGELDSGVGGLPGAAFLFAGNGGEGGAGGEILVRMARGGITPFSEDVPPGGLVRIEGGSGRGGDASSPGIAGGPAGSIRIESLDGDMATLRGPIAVVADDDPISTGGAGFDGCSVRPFQPGTGGGSGGDLITHGATFEIRGGYGESSFDGGIGGDGKGPAAGAAGGEHDGGADIGDNGDGGLACNDPAMIYRLATPLPPVHMLAHNPLQVVVEGTLIAPACVILFDQTELEGTVCTPESAQADVPSELQTPGEHRIVVRNPAPGGGDSNELTLELLTPIPHVETVSPAVVPRSADANTSLTIGGAGFIDGSEVRLNGQPLTTTFVSDIELTATVTPADAPTAGEFIVSVYSSGGGGESPETLPVVVQNPTPIVTAVSPSGALVGAAGGTVEFQGTGLFDDTQLSLNGIPLPTDADVMRIATTITPELLENEPLGAAFAFLLKNDAPGGGETTVDFPVVNPYPVISALSEARVTPGFVGPVVVSAENATTETEVWIAQGDLEPVELDVSWNTDASEGTVQLDGTQPEGTYQWVLIQPDVYPDDWFRPDGPFASNSWALEIADSDPCDVASPDLEVIQYGVTTPFTVDSGNCVGPVIAGHQTYYRLFRIDLPQVASQLGLQPDYPTEFSFLTPDGALIGFFVSSFRRVFYPQGPMIVKVATGTSSPGQASGEIAIAAASEETLGCSGVDIWAGATTTQTLSDTFEDLSCSNGNLDGDERRLDRYDVRIPPGRTIRITMTSSQVEPVLFFRIPPSSDYVVDETPGDGIAVIEFTNGLTYSQKGEITATTPFYDPSDPKRVGSYTITVELLP